MKDYSKEELEEGRPQFTALHCIEFCLSQLYADKTHTIGDTLANDRYTYEELIGTLLMARDTITEQDKTIEEYERDIDRLMED